MMATRLIVSGAAFVWLFFVQAFGQSPERELVTRKFKVDLRAFSQPMLPLGPIEESAVSPIVQRILQGRFAAAGIVFGENPFALTRPQSEKAMFFNERTGELFVRATIEDLETIERIVAQMQKPPPLVEIEASFLEVPELRIPYRTMPNGLTNISVLTEQQVRVMMRAYENLRGV